MNWTLIKSIKCLLKYKQLFNAFYIQAINIASINVLNFASTITLEEKILKEV